MLRRRAILVAWAAVAIPGMAAVASCVQDLPEGSVPELESGSDGTMKDSPAPPDHATVEGSPDAPPAEAEPDVSEDVSDAESADADAETADADAESTDADAESDVVDGGVAADSGDGGDASNAGDASDGASASDASDASDAGGANDASDAAGSSDASDAGGAGDAGDAASDASAPPCTFIVSGAICQSSDSCTVRLPGGDVSAAGDLLVLVFGAGIAIAPTVPSGWQQANLETDGTNGFNVGIWYYPNNPGGISSVTVTVGATASVRGILSEWRNATQLDQTASLMTTSAKSMTVSTPGITASGECAIAAFGQHVSTQEAITFTAGSGWTNLDNNGTSLTNYHVTGDYLLGPPLGAVSENQTSDTLGDWVGVVATFK